MILLGLGANLTSERFGPPRETLEAALDAIDRAGIAIAGRSPWYRTAPVPVSDQPWYVNGVARVETDLAAIDVLAALHAIEADFGRVRSARNEPRIVDLDLLAHGSDVIEPPAGQGGPIVPHPRLHQRAFVLFPLRDVAPGWRHPILGLTVEQLIAALPADQTAERMP